MACQLKQFRENPFLSEAVPIGNGMPATFVAWFCY